MDRPIFRPDSQIRTIFWNQGTRFLDLYKILDDSLSHQDPHNICF